MIFMSAETRDSTDIAVRVASPVGADRFFSPQTSLGRDDARVARPVTSGRDASLVPRRHLSPAIRRSLMELVETVVPPLTRRNRSLVVRHHEAGLHRALELGERVVVHDPDSDDHWSGVVADRDLDPACTETVYRIELGVRLPVDQARERVGRVAGHAALFSEEPVDVQVLLDLLGAVRASR